MPIGRSRSVALAVKCLWTAVLLTGCGTMRNTPEQDRIWAAYGECQAAGRVSNNVILTRVEADGRYWIETRNGNAGLPEFMTCINERVRLGAGR